ncbi:MAG: glycosyltransferase family 2 protein [Leptospiraceae bacterium]|nr:glycosyltransferase family 2 protein [Leptospiraceae bacterium]
MSSKKKNFLIIIPVYNEEESVLQVANKTFSLSQDFSDILFINDGSSDNSSKILKSIHQQGIFLIDKDKNEGYGASLISGIDFGLKNDYQFLITMDCDEQHQPEDLKRFRDFDHKIDLVSGSRYAPKSKELGIKPPKDRVEINRRITGLLNKKYSLNLTDAFCGFKRYKSNAFKNHGFDNLGYASPMELWSFVHSHGLTVREIAVDKIYITDDRSFGEDLDRKRKRYRYYLESWNIAHKKYFQENLYFYKGGKFERKQKENNISYSLT